MLKYTMQHGVYQHILIVSHIGTLQIVDISSRILMDIEEDAFHIYLTMFELQNT